MKALVTGGAGFIGSHLTELLLSQGHDVVVVDNLSTGRLSNLRAHSQLTFYEIDICQPSPLSPLFAGVDWVFHIAGLAGVLPSIENPRAYYQTNVEGTLRVLEAAQIAAVSSFIYAASSSCYGMPDHYPTTEEAAISPQNPYALTKYIGEALVREWHRAYGLPVISLRLFNVYGPRLRGSGAAGAVCGIFCTQKREKKPYTVVGDGRQMRDFIYVTDVAAACVRAAQATSSYAGEVFNVGSGLSHSINRLVDLLGGERVYIPRRPGEPDKTCAAVDKLYRCLGWQPVISFEAGISLLLGEAGNERSLEDNVAVRGLDI